MPSSPRLRRCIAALLMGLLLAPLVAEAAYRVSRNSGLSPTTNPAYVVHDPALGWRYVAGMHARHTSDDFDVQIDIHADGFRGREWPPASDTRKRLLVLGDSLAFGWGVSADEMFSTRLAELLPDWCVLNAAISGTSTGQQLLLLRELLARPDFVRPAAIVRVFCSNDLFENGSAVVYGKRKPWFELAGESLLLHGVPVTQPFGARWSLLVRALHKLNWEREFARAPRDLDAEWALERALSRQLMATAGPGVTLFVVSEVPDPDQSRAIVPGLIHIDVRAALDAGPTYFEHDPHWNAAGHAAVAACLRDALRTDAVD